MDSDKGCLALPRCRSPLLVELVGDCGYDSPRSDGAACNCRCKRRCPRDVFAIVEDNCYGSRHCPIRLRCRLRDGCAMVGSHGSYVGGWHAVDARQSGRMDDALPSNYIP